MSVSGHDAILAMKPTATWGTAVTLGASNGFIVRTIDRITLGGEPEFDDGAGLGTVSQYDRFMDEANPNVVASLRWNSVLWCVLAQMIGDDTKTGPTGNIYTHTLNWQEENPLAGGICQGIEINNTANGIFEIPSYKVTSLSLEADGGVWNMNYNTMGDTVLHGGDATFDGTAADNVTSYTEGQRMRYKANQLRRNAQAGGALGSGDVIADASNMVISFERNYDPMDDVLKGSSTTDRRRAEPVENYENGAGPVIILAYDIKTAVLDTSLDDLNDSTEYKADVVMAETIGSDAHTFTQEFGRLVAMDPQVAIDRHLRIPRSNTYRAIVPSATPTGLSTANPYHAILGNLQNLTYETYA